MGVSWTTVKTVAARFAVGHRFLPVPDPTIAAALVPKLAVFSVQLERKEREVIIDPHLALRIDQI